MKMKQYTHWVVGFLFNTSNEVALVRKTHPAWQAGKLNGVGGKIGQGESPADAMCREFVEEAGARVSDWREFALLKGQDGQVHFFAAHGDYGIASPTDEKVGWYKISDLRNLPIIENLEWLVPLALDPGNKYATIDYFQSQSVDKAQVDK